MPRKTTILIYDGDDMERLADLRREVEIAKRQAEQESGVPLREGDDLPAVAERQAEAAYESFVDEAAERAEAWELHAIGHEAFRELLREHPPRKVVESVDGKDVEVTHPDDAGWDVNTETFPKALLTFVDPDDEDHRTVAAPFESAGTLQKRLRRLSSGEFDSLWAAALMMNSAGIVDPKAAISWRADPKSSAT